MFGAGLCTAPVSVIMIIANIIWGMKLFGLSDIRF